MNKFINIKLFDFEIFICTVTSVDFAVEMKLLVEFLFIL